MAETTSSSIVTPFTNSPAPSETRLVESFWQQRHLSRPRLERSDSEETAAKRSDETHLHRPRLSPKSRSLSDTGKQPPLLQAAALRGLSRSSKDDTALNNSPATPRKSPSLQGLSLQLPPRPFVNNSPGAASVTTRAPLSPKLDAAQIYGSPSSVLPRRSRGLDFSRACTNLHHSTLAESSPDSSPTIGGRGVNIPQRRGTGTSGFGSPGMMFGQNFPSSSIADRTAMSSSVSSANMMESDTSSCEDDDDDAMNADRDEVMITVTPQASKIGGGLSNPFGAPVAQSPGNDWMGGHSPAAASLLSFQRARFRNGRKSRHSSSSASGNSSKPSPGPLSPPVLKSIETSNGGYFAREMSKSAMKSRRESLSLGTRDLHLSDLSDDGDSRGMRGDSPAGGSSTEGGPRGVIRRAVTRRGNLLPKTKNFARIRAALMEESAPLDSEAKREADVIRQVRESDPAIESKSSIFPPDKLPDINTKGISDERDTSTLTREASTTSFRNQASRNSGGLEFWNSFDDRYRTPPPPAHMSGRSSVMSEDSAMETPQLTPFGVNELSKPLRRSPTPQAANPPLVTELRRKRRRDDDLDPESFKRRAVSPGMSVQSSPVLAHSPIVKDGNAWIVPPKSLPAIVPSEAGSISASGHTSSMKRVGLQGMTETNDGLMNMSIE